MTENERLDFFEELLLSCHNLYLWKFSANFTLIQSTCPMPDLFRSFLSMDGGEAALQDWIKGHARPLVLTNSADIMWTADFSSKTEEICVLGPYFDDDAPIREVRKRIKAMPLPAQQKAAAVSLVEALPVISQSKILEYAIMLHRAAAKETISVSDLSYQSIGQNIGASTAAGARRSPDKSVTIHGTYDAEQEMLRAVREGDTVNFKKIMNRMAKIGTMGQMAQKGDRKRLMKNAVLVNIILFSRAAVDGGLPPDLSLSLADRYMQGVETCRTLQELRELTTTMQEDYVTRVHRIRENQEISNVSRSVLAWLDVHLEEKIQIDEIAAELGYSTYYLSRRFKKEVGKSIGECLREKRIEQAKFLLQSTDLPVHEISDRLWFNSPSYFTSCFCEAVGMLPTAYRSQHRQM